jgi:hypothetical protein
MSHAHIPSRPTPKMVATTPHHIEAKRVPGIRRETGDPFETRFVTEALTLPTCPFCGLPADARHVCPF